MTTYSNYIMSIEQAIFRRIRLGQSFCSYTFNPVSTSGSGKRKHTTIRIQRINKNSSNCSLSRITNDTIQLPFSSSNCTINRSSNKLRIKDKSFYSQKISGPGDDERLKQKQCSDRQNKLRKNKKIKTFNHLEESNTQEKLNKIQEYLSDFHKLRSQYQFKTNMFQNIPKIYKHELTQCTSDLKFSRKNTKLHGEKQHRITKLPKDLLSKKFIPSQHPQLFYDFSLEQGYIQMPFTTFKMVNIASNKIISCSVSYKIFSQIPMKQYCHYLNNFATNLEQNIFYVGLSKQKMQGIDKFAYTECFFWLGRPIKHTQRLTALNYILSFFEKSILELKNQNQIPMKVWIVDFNGKISYINRGQIKKPTKTQINININIKQEIENDLEISCRNVQQICLSMFISSIQRGIFSNNKMGESFRAVKQ